jgi:hypothetical protein
MLTVPDSFENIIWEGRFQPIHRGHISYIDLLLRYRKKLWIFVVANERSTDVISNPSALPVINFTETVDLHHEPEKNPLPFWLRYKLVVSTLSAEFPEAPITVWGGRRLDLQWELYDRLFPPNRVFITPERDEFEDAKAAAWNQLGESVIRVDISKLPKISATQIRTRMKEGLSVDDLMSPVTIEVLKETGYLEKLLNL